MTVLSDLQADLAIYIAARAKIINGEEISIGNMRLRRSSLEFVEKKIKELRFDIARLQDGISHSLPVFRHR